jgi:hypothetical protein
VLNVNYLQRVRVKVEEKNEYSLDDGEERLLINEQNGKCERDWWEKGASVEA